MTIQTADAPANLLEPDFLRLLERIAFMLQGRIRGTRVGARSSVRRGTGLEFEDHRAYAVGDDLRALDWQVFARLDSLFIRLYQEPQEHDVHILLDASASMGCGKGGFVQRLAAALAYMALCGDDRVGVFALRDKLEGAIGPIRGKRLAPRIFHFLQGVEFGGQTDLERSVREVARAARRGTVIFISDFLTPQGRVEALRILASQRLRVIVLHVLSPDERNPPLGEDITLVDSETGEQLTVSIDRGMHAAYMEQLSLLVGELQHMCRAYGFAFVPVSSETPLEALILGDLRKTGAVAAMR